MNKLQAHWVADMYPLNEADVEALAADIKAHGQIAPIKITHDGLIIDGRNRWLACEKAGVEPTTEVVNPDGKEFTDEQAFALATSCNSMRRDMGASLRACLAAEAWKRLHPKGAPTGAAAHSKRSKNGLLAFEDFALASFKVGKTYAKQALAILNSGNSELFAEARDNLNDAYVKFLEDQKKKAQDDKNRERLQRPDHKDLWDLVQAGSLKFEDAVAAMEKRMRDELERERVETERRETIVRDIYSICFSAAANNLTAADVRAWMDGGLAQNMTLGESRDEINTKLVNTAKLFVAITKENAQ